MSAHPVVKLKKVAVVKSTHSPNSTANASDAINARSLAQVVAAVNREGGTVPDVKDVHLSSAVGLDARLADTEQLAASLGAATRGVHALIARAIELTEQRCRAEGQRAVDVATASAVRSTERRMTVEREAAVRQAVAETWAEAKAKEQAAVERAVHETELRCAEEQRIAVQLATSAINLEWGKSQEEVAAENAAKSFEQAARAAGAALMAAQGLQWRGHAPAKPAAAAPVEPKPTDATQGSSGGLEFF
ncbi:hypothetical protein AB1Y20_007066 [Prymnesium parvum]|uniref:Prohibitin n=1 Tax=Prymnesium parvum TaxID=97485 RepID=A0AB34J1Q3_PRYPA